jgi:predicted metal-binding protein
VNFQALLDLAAQCGFEHAGELNVAALHFDPKVREMCAADLCHSYGHCWTCPPGCGTLEEIAQKAARYSKGILLQSTGQMEEDFDVETMLGTEQTHKERFARFVRQVQEIWPACLPMASGACRICPSCTYPDAPCRFPDRAIPSMEAYGLMVSKVCQDSGLPYYYGPDTITYTSCVLLE